MVRFGAATTDIFSSFHSGVDVMNSRNTAICLLLCSSSLTAAETPDFSRQILPVLSENCFQCHGPDAEQREAGLALHEQSAAMKVIREGDRSASELYSRITSSDPDTVMPPPDSGLELTAEERELIGSWIGSRSPDLQCHRSAARTAQVCVIRLMPSYRISCSRRLCRFPLKPIAAL